MKTKSVHIALATLLGLAIPASFAAQQTKSSQQHRGQSSQGMTERNQPQARGESQFSGRITDINRRDKTIVVEDAQQGRQTLHIGSDTRFMRGSESVAWNQLKEGEEIRATATKTGEMNHATSVEIQQQPQQQSQPQPQQQRLQQPQQVR